MQKNSLTIQPLSQDLATWANCIRVLPESALCVDTHGGILLCNDAALKLLGYSTDELLNYSLPELLPVCEKARDDYHCTGICLPPTLCKQRIWDGSEELLIKTRSGTEIPVLISVSQVSTDEAVPLFLILLKDIRQYKTAEARLLDEQKRFEILFNSINDALFLAPIDQQGNHGNFVEVNDIACQRLGYSREEFTTMNARTINPAPNLERVKSFGRRILREGHTQFEAIHVAKDGTQFPVEILAKVIHIGEQKYVLSVARDLREQKRLERAESRFGRLLDHAWDEIYVFDSKSLKFLQANQGALDNLGYSKQEIEQLIVTDIKPNHTEAQFRKLTEPLLNGTQSQMVFETIHRRKDGSDYPVEIRLQLSHSEVPPVFLANVQDITARQRSEKRLKYLANYDSLTNLPNRALFIDRLRMALESSNRNDTLTAVMFLDLDGFKTINDRLGHDVGDELLKRVANRLGKTVRKMDTVSRLGGDEFTIILTDLKEVCGAEAVARKVTKSLNRPFMIDGQELRISTSIGITLYPFNDGDNEYSLLKQADTAMYYAKDCGKNNYQFYSASLAKNEEWRQALETNLRLALVRGELSLHYQPKIDLKTGKVNGAEALLRWNSHALGPVSPAEFIPLMERSGIIIEVGSWVLKEACQQLHIWLQQGIDLRISVNISARQITSHAFVKHVEEILHNSEVPADRLEIEITEGILISQTREAGETLHELKELGLKISLDDFGSGYSSLNYIKEFPIDIIKIDRSFIKDLNQNRDSTVIVETILALAKGLGLSVTAEGIETDAQLQHLKRLGCHEAQGFLFSKPVTVSDFTAYFVATNNAEH